MTVNVPLVPDAVAGDARLDANNAAIVWAGDISPDGGYTQLRIMGRGDGVSLYVQNMTPQAGGTFTVSLGNATFGGTLNAADGWQYEGTGIGARGWAAWRLVPWAALGGMPLVGDVWPLTLTAHDGAQWDGVIRWGAPAYAGTVSGAQVVTVPVTADASLGGGTDCGYDNDPNVGRDASFFDDWGSESLGAYGSEFVNLGAIGYANVQAQWDTTDWPCYARYIAKWGLPQLPEGAQVVGAWLDVYYFGSAYPGPNDVPEYKPHQLTQAYQVGTAWDEDSVTWDNAPAPIENVSYTALDWCDEGVDCHGWRSLDITPIVQRAYAAGQPDVAALLYTAAGQYHSGRYIYTREGGAPPVVRVAYVVESPTWTPTATATATATPTTRPAPIATPTPTLTATPSPTPSPVPVSPTATALPITPN
jgi:hypothetical protein